VASSQTVGVAGLQRLGYMHLMRGDKGIGHCFGGSEFRHVVEYQVINADDTESAISNRYVRLAH
jgi:hypothetical protein